jgi:hypothetical protein
MVQSSPVRRLDFYKLSREKQERFLESTRGSAPPAPIVQVVGDQQRGIMWAAGAGAALIAVIVIYTMQFGVLGASLAVHGGGFLLLYAGLLFAIPYCGLRAAAAFLGKKILPFKPGVYVFPMCAVDARDKVLKIFAMTDLANVGKATAGGALRLSFKGGGSFAFPAKDEHEASSLNLIVENAQEQVKHALASGDDSELTTLDPFYEARKSWTSPIGPKEPIADRAPPWRKFDYAIAAAVALTIGPTLWFLHNKSSDDSMLKKAVAQNTPESFQSYLSVGKRHTDEVAGTLLPRAELTRAKTAQTVEAVQAFLDAHPKSAIDGEAQDALREALLRELDKAKKGASLASLAAFQKKYPNNGLAKEIAAAKHDFYAAAINRFKATAPSDDPQLLAFVTRLSKWLEAHGPEMMVVFHREVSAKALEQADKFMAGSGANRAFGPHQVTKYFPETADQPKESEVAAAFDKAMKKIFGPDLIDVKMGPKDPDEAAQAALVAKEPLVSVRYRFGWLGVVQGSIPLKRAFAGVHVSGEATFTVPDGAGDRKVKIEVPATHALLMKYDAQHDGLSAPPADEANAEVGVYLAEDLRALDHIASLLENTFIKKEK